jgi:hypothetical protein
MRQSHFWAAMGAAVGRLVLPAGQPLGLALFLLLGGFTLLAPRRIPLLPLMLPPLPPVRLVMLVRLARLARLAKLTRMHRRP